MTTIHLLTHERELSKPSNTGKLALDALPDLVHRTLWQRKQPAPELLRLLTKESVALVYPVDKSESTAPEVELASVEHYVLLDGTWQEARKIYNRSPYLQSLPVCRLPDAEPSRFIGRRNQRDGGLCTAECIIALLLARGMGVEADRLERAFLASGLAAHDL